MNVFVIGRAKSRLGRAKTSYRKKQYYSALFYSANAWWEASKATSKYKDEIVDQAKQLLANTLKQLTNYSLNEDEQQAVKRYANWYKKNKALYEPSNLPKHNMEIEIPVLREIIELYFDFEVLEEKQAYEQFTELANKLCSYEKALISLLKRK